MAAKSSNTNCNNNKSNSSTIHCVDDDDDDLTLELLSTCIDAVQHGCAIIRRVQQEGSLKVSYKDDSDSRSAVTRADVEAQSFIIDSITNYWQTRKGEIPNIIGEEDQGMTKNNNACSSLVVRLRGNLVQPNSFFSPMETAQPLLPSIQSLSQVTLYVDPLDGTREFVEGRYENVSCLIGISIHGRPVAGVIGLPFATTETEKEDDVHVVYGLVGRGIGYCTANYNCLEKTITEMTCGQPGIPTSYINEQRTSNNNASLMTGDSFDRSPLLSNMLTVARAALEKDDVTVQHDIVGGAGKKMLLCAYASCCTSSTNNQRVQFSFKKQSTYLWDTCAPEAILYAVGGKVTDAFGSPLVYNTNKLFTKNSLGVIASCSHGRNYHDAICRTLVFMKETSSTSLL